MNEEEYISQRVDNQINWYSKNSQSSQRKYKLMRSYEIAAAASIPVIAAVGGVNFQVNLIVAILGASIAIASGILSLTQYQENWTEYRTTAESLKHEKYLFLTRSTPYHEEEPFQFFVNRVENLISKENTDWSTHVKTGVKNDKAKT